MQTQAVTTALSASRHKRNPVNSRDPRSTPKPADGVDRLLKRRLSHYAADASFPTFLETLYYES